MTSELIILAFIAALLVVNTVIKIIAYQEDRSRHKEYVESITRLCNLNAERTDEHGGEQNERQP